MRGDVLALGMAERQALAAEAKHHQPRERAVPCTKCRRPTWRVHAVCTSCGPETCSRCTP